MRYITLRLLTYLLTYCNLPTNKAELCRFSELIIGAAVWLQVVALQSGSECLCVGIYFSGAR